MNTVPPMSDSSINKMESCRNWREDRTLQSRRHGLKVAWMATPAEIRLFAEATFRQAGLPAAKTLSIWMYFSL
jgi:hypothetical protein